VDGEPRRRAGAVYRGWDEHEEANFVAQTILKTRADGVGWDGIAVFYRTNAQSRVLEDALRRARIPYVIVAVSGSTSARRSRTRWRGCGWPSIGRRHRVSPRRAGAAARGGATTLARLDELALDHNLRC